MAMKIALMGCGKVARSLLDLLSGKEDYLRRKTGLEVLVSGACARTRGSFANPDGVRPAVLLAHIEKGENLGALGKPGAPSCKDVPAFLENSGADVLVELTPTDIQTAEPASSHIRAAIECGMHTVTANKGPAALNYHELKKLAEDRGVKFLIEGTVLAGIPVFSVIENALAGCRISRVTGALNATTNLILTHMEEKDASFAEAFVEAERLGLLETDKTADIEGRDALAKFSILGTVALGQPLRPDEIECEGISGITLDYVRAAKSEGKRFRLYGDVRLEDGRAVGSVMPAKLHASDTDAAVKGTSGAVTLHTDDLGKVTIFAHQQGPGETAGGVVSDLLQIREYVKTRESGKEKS